jgi:MFS family permease
MLRALGRPAVLVGFWIFTIPALFSGVIEVLVPLRLDDLGVAGATIGLVFLSAAAVEAVVSPIAGRFSDRAGRMAPIRVGLTGAVIMAIVLPVPRTAVLVGLGVVLSFVALASFWAPGMAMLSDAAEEAGLDQALAFAISNLAWALGHVFGAGVGGAVADATTDTVPYAALAVLCATTLGGLTLARRRQEALST